MSDKAPVPRRANGRGGGGLFGEVVRSGILAARLATSTAATATRLVARTADSVIERLPGGSTYAMVRDVVARQLEELQELPIGLDPLHLLSFGDADHLDGEWPSRSDLLRVMPQGTRDLLPFEVEERRVDADVARERFRALLDRSLQTDPEDEDLAATAYVNVIEQMTPDEARIVRLLSQGDGHAVACLHAAPRLGFSGGEVVLEHLSLVGDRAGCHFPDRTPRYVENLLRLGLVRIHDRPVDDNGEYELIELRDDYEAAAAEIESKGLRPRTERQTLRLTPFGRRFVEVCVLPAD